MPCLAGFLAALPSPGEVFLLSGTFSPSTTSYVAGSEVTIDPATGVVTDANITINALVPDTITGAPTYQGGGDIIWNDGTQVLFLQITGFPMTGYSGGPIEEASYYYDNANDTGDIFSTSYNSELTPVPEPSTLILLLPALVGVGLRANSFHGRLFRAKIGRIRRCSNQMRAWQISVRHLRSSWMQSRGQSVKTMIPSPVSRSRTIWIAGSRDFAPALELRLRRDLMMHDESGAAVRREGGGE